MPFYSQITTNANGQTTTIVNDNGNISQTTLTEQSPIPSYSPAQIPIMNMIIDPSIFDNMIVPMNNIITDQDLRLETLFHNFINTTMENSYEQNLLLDEDNYQRGLSNATWRSLKRRRILTTKPTCPICFENFKKNNIAVYLPCGEAHFFHKDCIKKWFQNHRTCPMCRFELEI